MGTPATREAMIVEIRELLNEIDRLHNLNDYELPVLLSILRAATARMNPARAAVVARRRGLQLVD